MWQKILPEVFVYRDSCNVYAVESPDGMVAIDAGSGAWLDHAADLPKPVVAVACTHYFRDHSAGLAEAARRGFSAYVPEYEEEIFRDPNQHFRQRESYIVYDNLWDRFSPILPTIVAGVLRDYERVTLAGREFEVIPLPGVTCGQVGLATTLSNGCRIVFCAEAIHSPGRLARIAPLQYNYNDLSGAIGAYASARRLSELNVDALLPSLGEPMLDHCEDALSRLRTNIEAMVSVRPWGAGMVREFEAEDLEQVTEHVWLDRKSVANTWFLVADSGKVMAIDYGYDIAMAGGWPGYPKKDRRRALLHGLKSLEARVGARRIDVVLVSHFHDDHVAGIPVLQRLHGTECWAPANFAELLEHPEAHTFPCGWPFPITVQRKLDLDQTFEWEGFVFHLAPMSGHTRFSALIGFEADGKRFAHTGDQYFFGEGVESFEKNSRMQNHVYRNGALLDGYEQSGKWMLDWRPDIVLQGHQPPMFTDEHFFRHIAEWSHDYADLARDVMPLGDDETHFNLDSWGGWIWPYRIVQDSLEPFTVEVTVRNPLPYAATLAVELQGPIGWSTTQETLFAGPRREVRCQLTMTPNARCRRQPIAVSLVADGKPFGQVAEALVTIGNGSVW